MKTSIKQNGFCIWGMGEKKEAARQEGSSLSTTNLTGVPMFSFDRLQKDGRLSQPYKPYNLMNLVPLDWKSSKHPYR